MRRKTFFLARFAMTRLAQSTFNFIRKFADAGRLAERLPHSRNTAILLPARRMALLSGTFVNPSTGSLERSAIDEAFGTPR